MSPFLAYGIGSSTWESACEIPRDTPVLAHDTRCFETENASRALVGHPQDPNHLTTRPLSAGTCPRHRSNSAGHSLSLAPPAPGAPDRHLAGVQEHQAWERPTAVPESTHKQGSECA